jgi:hypothetical protein
VLAALFVAVAVAVAVAVVCCNQSATKQQRMRRKPRGKILKNGQWSESLFKGLQNNMSHFVTVQCGLRSIELKVKAGALVFRIEIEVGADASHLDHGPTSPRFSAAGCGHCHGCFYR